MTTDSATIRLSRPPVWRVRKGPLRGLLSTCLVLAACVGSQAYAQSVGVASTSSRLMVIPFENIDREPTLYWLSEGAAVLLTDDLLALGAPAISRDDRLRAFDRLRVPPVATLSHATVIRLGQVIGARDVVVGGFELLGEELVVHARVLHLDTGRMAPELVERGPLADLFSIHERIALRLARVAVAPEQLEQERPPVAVFEQYIKGLLAEAPERKVEFLTEALRLSPAFEPARIALWRVHTELGDHQRALVMVRQVPLSHRLSRQARFRAAVSLLYVGRLAEAFNEFRELHASMPDSGLANNMGVAQLRRPAGAAGGRATSFFAEAAALDASDPDLLFNLGYAYGLEGDFRGATDALREVVRRDPADAAAHFVLAAALESSGRAAEAARERELAAQLSSAYAAGDASDPDTAGLPRGLERVKVDVDVTPSLRVEEALVAAEQRDHRELAMFHLDRGRRFLQEERDGEALAELGRVVYLLPYQSEAHLLLARVYRRLGRVEEAVNALKISVWSDPGNDEARDLLDQMIADPSSVP